MIIVDKLCYLSKLRYVSPYEKFAFAMLTLIFCIVSRSIGMGVLVLILNAYLTIVRGGISARRFVNLMLVPLAFLLLSTAAIIINFSHAPLDAFAVRIGDWYVTGSWTSIHRGVQMTITALASVSCLYFLSFNTTMTDILTVLRRLHVPPLIVELMLLIYRYIFVLLDVAYYITTSQSARLGYRNLSASYRSFAAMVQALFVRAMKRSRCLYDAMEARGYDGEIKVLEESRPVCKKNVILIAVCETVLLGVTIWMKLHP
ncbi:cobalt ECF transporter T component CbiQ [Ihubacter sp. rT4E-8]|uniref:cobalt ECF transporter T component CbiQ n=1 Tax=Ihubacter sp. rT4E-8 TaxID=3242369 RepID=UPI003CED1B9F